MNGHESEIQYRMMKQWIILGAIFLVLLVILIIVLAIVFSIKK